MTDQPNHFHFSTDRPIDTYVDDRLGRKQFADSLANAISGWRKKESLVIGLFGNWGSGKTSIKNTILENFQKIKDPPEIAEFNPWQLVDQDQLYNTFFREISFALGRADKTEEREKRIQKLKEYASAIKFSASIVPWSQTKISENLKFIVLAVGFLGLGRERVKPKVS